MQLNIVKKVNYPAAKDGGASDPTNSPSLMGLTSGKQLSFHYPKEVCPVWSFASLTPYTGQTFLIQRKVGVFTPPMDKTNWQKNQTISQ